MIDINQVPKTLLEDIARNLGWREDDFREDYDPEQDPIEPYLKRIERMSARDAFNCFLVWHGIGGYTDRIIRTLDALRAAELAKIEG